METVTKKSIRLVEGHKGGFVNRLGGQITPFDLVKTDEDTAEFLLQTGDFEAASEPRRRPVEPEATARAGGKKPAPINATVPVEITTAPAATASAPKPKQEPTPRSPASAAGVGKTRP